MCDGIWALEAAVCVWGKKSEWIFWHTVTVGLNQWLGLMDSQFTAHTNKLQPELSSWRTDGSERRIWQDDSRASQWHRVSSSYVEIFERLNFRTDSVPFCSINANSFFKSPRPHNKSGIFAQSNSVQYATRSLEQKSGGKRNAQEMKYNSNTDTDHEMMTFPECFCREPSFHMRGCSRRSKKQLENWRDYIINPNISH